MNKGNDEPPVKITVAPGVSELVYRTGDAPRIEYPEKINLQGDIRSVGSYLKVRRENAKGTQVVDIAKCVVLISKKNLYITLLLDPENTYGAQVKGTLRIAPELDKFKINQNKVWKRDEFRELVKFSKQYFTDKTKWAELLKVLGSLQSQVNYNKGESEDDRGNRDIKFTQSVTSNMPDGFKLDLPIYENFDSETVDVDICIGVKDGTLHFWLESVQLEELMEVKRDIIFNEQLELAKDLVTIYQ